ncbi:MAG: phosphatase PAP2 family protein [Gemmatimonadota bacterium]|nr:phosphatase PAP2 family protein [Gemmatimonadota bacterium]
MTPGAGSPGAGAPWASRPFWVATLLPVLVQAAVYAAIGVVNSARPMHDALVVALEARWFGVPSHAWAMRWPSPAISLLLHGCYLSYYLLLVVPYARLAWRGEPAALRETRTAHFVTLGVGCVLFLVWPVEGPRFRAPLEATVLPDLGHRLTDWILATFSARGTAFPSSHMSIAVTQLLLAWRYQRPLVYLLAPATVGIGVGAVYGGYHYLVDVLAGALLGVLCVVAVRWSRARRG